MKIVIDIPDEIRKSIFDGVYCGIIDERVYNAIKDGTPLPAEGQQSVKTGWIPCSERMPEDGDTYIVSGYETWEGKKLPFVDCATYPGSYIDKWDTYNDWCEG